MSHHLDTPLAAQTGQLYLDDLYVFPGETGTVLVMNVNSTITGAHAEPAFHPEARYEFKLHIDGAAFEDLTYRISFAESDAAGRQTLRLYALSGNDARDDAATGELVLESRTGETATGPDVRLWAGRTGDSFYVDLSLLAMVNSAVRSGTAVDLSQWNPVKAENSFTDTTVETIVLEISHLQPQMGPGTRIGVWAATKLATDAGGWRQINRAGHPMMWPIFWPDDTHFTNPANGRHPSEDAAASPRHRRAHRRHRRGDRHVRRSTGLRRGRGRRAVPRRPALRRRISVELRVRRPQRPVAGRQRARGHALPRHEHRRSVRAEGRRCPPTCAVTRSRTSSQPDAAAIRSVGRDLPAGAVQVRTSPSPPPRASRSAARVVTPSLGKIWYR